MSACDGKPCECLLNFDDLETWSIFQAWTTQKLELSRVEVTVRAASTEVFLDTSCICDGFNFD